MRWNSDADDGYCTGSAGSGNNNSDIESVIEERLGSITRAWERPYHSFAVQTRRNGVEDKLIAWKEARTMKLMNKYTIPYLFVFLTVPCNIFYGATD